MIDQQWLARFFNSHWYNSSTVTGRIIQQSRADFSFFYAGRNLQQWRSPLKNRAMYQEYGTWSGSVYKQSLTGVKSQGQKRKRRNRAVIKKFLKTGYFLARRKWAVRENFQDVIEFIKDLRDEDLPAHLRESSTRATYVSTASTDEFITCLSDFLEEGFINKLTARRQWV